MPVIAKYIVERNGEEKMTFTSKAQADAYDKMLDMADELYLLIDQSNLIAEDAQKEALSLFLTEHKEAVLIALGAKRPNKNAVSSNESSRSTTSKKAPLAEVA